MSKSFDNGAWTSEVADQMAETLKPRVRQELLSHFARVAEQGATDQELEAALQRPGNTIRPGRVYLAREGLVVDSGKWRWTASHRPAIVWILSSVREEKKNLG